MTLFSNSRSGSRRTLIILTLVGALALPPAFAQSAAPQAQADPAGTTAATPQAQTPMQEGAMTAQAATPAEPAASAKPVGFKQLDANKDGKLSREEVSGDATWTADFDAADANKDGYLSKAEFKKHESELRKVAKVDQHR